MNLTPNAHQRIFCCSTHKDRRIKIKQNKNKEKQMISNIKHTLVFLMSCIIVTAYGLAQDHFVVTIPETGTSSLVTIQNSVTTLDAGDEVGIFDANGLLNNLDCDPPVYGELLVASGVWTGSQMDLTAIGSNDLCDFGGFQQTGFISSNPIIIKVWKAAEDVEYDATPTLFMGSGNFDGLFSVYNEITLDIPVFYNVVINEFFFRPNASDTPDYVELFNNDVADVDLTGWTLNGMAISGGTISAMGYFLLAIDDPFYDVDGNDYYAGDNLPNSAMIDLGLGTTADNIVLARPNGATQDVVNYDGVAGWPTGTANKGYAVELIDPDSDNNDPASWASALETPVSMYLYLDDGSEWDFGSPLEQNTVNGTPGCTDAVACNYDPLATIDDGTCTYPEDANHDCAGNCIVDIDCAGVCGGSAAVDECGVCDGPGIPLGECDCDGNVLGCDDVCGSGLVDDECGICDGLGAVYECGCEDMADGACDCDGNVLDDCGVCGGTNDCINYIPTVGLEVDHEGGIAWNVGVDGGGEPVAVGHDIYWGAAGIDVAYQYMASRDYLDPLSDTGLHVSGDIQGFTNFQAALAGFGFDPGLMTWSFAYASLGGDVEGVDWMYDPATTTETRYYTGGTYEIAYSGSPMFSGPMPDITMSIQYHDLGTPFDDQISALTGYFIPTDASQDSGNEIQDLAAAFLTDVGEFGVRFTMDSFQPAGQVEYADTWRSGAYFEAQVSAIEGAQDFVGEPDCFGIIDGDAVEDDCGVCGGDNSSCTDCAGVINGNSYEDYCFVCDDDPTNDSFWFDSLNFGGAYDCDAVCFGDSENDMCGTCDDDSDNDCVQDCLDVWGGSAEYDECMVCDGDNSTCADCAGVPNGPNYEDMCGTCDDDPENDCEPPFGFNQSTEQAFYFFTTATIDGVELEIGLDWIGIFNGPICVGAAAWDGEYTSVVAMGDDGYGMTDGYLNPGDTPTFVIYDASADDFYDAEAFGVTPNLEFGNLAQIFVDELAAVLTTTFTLDLHAGANLVSFYVLPDPPTLNNVLDGCVDYVQGVIGEGTVATPHPVIPGAWIGNLDFFEATSGYWILLSEACTITFDGWPVDAATTFGMHAGANLASYPFAVSNMFTDALPSDVLDLIIAIIGEGTVATPHPVTPGAWIGNLDYLDGGKGYWYLLEDAVSFMYNSPMLSRSDFRVPIENNLSGYEYVQSSEQAFYFVDGVQLNDHVLSENDWLLAYNGNVLVGKARWQGEYTSISVMGDNGTELSAGYCQAGDIPSFKLMKDFTGEVINLSGNIQAWESNGLYLTGSLDEAAFVPASFVLNEVYPNPFNPTTTISYSIPAQAEVQVMVFDIMGRQVAVLANEVQSEGAHFVTFDASGYSSGMYFVKLISNGEILSQKIMLMK